MTMRQIVLQLQRLSHSSVYRFGTAVACLGLGFAAWTGMASPVRPVPAATTPAYVMPVDQEVLDDLAYRVGELQGQVLALEALRERLAAAAGLAYSAPELVEPAAGLRPAARTPLSAVSRAVAPGGTARQLGVALDDLTRRVDRQRDALTLVDVALAREAGRQAGLPTRAPLAVLRPSSAFGWRRNPLTGRMAMHEGLDFVAARGSAIRAASGGLVVRAGYVRGYGRMVELDHGNGLRTRYAHAASLAVRTGDIVRQGDLIARAGSSGRSTGAHLHFEVRVADYPLDPELFMRHGMQSPVAHDTARRTRGVDG